MNNRHKALLTIMISISFALSSVKMDRRLRRLTDLGLKGVEGFYSGFTPRLCRETLSFAERYGLYVTAGSDYHGKNKMIAPGDTGPADVSDAPEGLRRFLADVNILNG